MRPRRQSIWKNFAGGDLLGEMLRHIGAVAGNQEELAPLAERLAVLEQSRPGVLEQAGIRLKDPNCLKSWLHQAEGLLVGHLLSGGDS